MEDSELRKKRSSPSKGNDQQAPPDIATSQSAEVIVPDRSARQGDESLNRLLASVLNESEKIDASPVFGDAFEAEEALGEPARETAWATGPAGQLPRSVLDRLVQRPGEALRDVLDATLDQGRSIGARLSISDVGTVRQVGDGVASVSGLPQATTDELLQFPSGVMGLVMNLDTDWIDCILLGSDKEIQGGDVVWSTGERFTIPVGDRLLGRVVNPLGRALDGRGRVLADERRFIERVAPSVVERQPVNQPLYTGIKAIDAIFPIGRGQRELIIGDRQTGKTSIALAAMINQRQEDLLCVYVSIGQRRTSALEVIHTLEGAGALDHTVVVVAAPDEPPALVYLAPYVGCTIAEAFLDHGRDVLIIYDDLTKHADAYRELSLLLRRPPGREAYPGDIFYLHARLLERAARLADALGGGSITALPIVETRRGNITAYIPTNLISITDGQIYLTPELFNQNIKPAIDVGLSVSRVGAAAQTPIMRKISAQLKLVLAQYEEVAHFARFGAEIDRATRQQITRGQRLREVLKQPAYVPVPVARQILILYAAGQGYLDDLPLQQVSRCERELWRYAQREYPNVIRRIESEGDLDADLAEAMARLTREFMARFS